MNVIFHIEGIPQLNKRLDDIANIVANPIAKAALEAGGRVVQAKAETEVHRLTGALASDVVEVTRIRNDGTQKYVLIGPGWLPSGVGRSASNRAASGRGGSSGAGANPGLYGYFLEEGHRAPGKGLSHDLEYKRDSYRARKRGEKINSHDYGHISTPPYPWLGPAFESTKDEAVEVMADVIKEQLEGLGL